MYSRTRVQTHPSHLYPSFYEFCYGNRDFSRNKNRYDSIAAVTLILRLTPPFLSSHLHYSIWKNKPGRSIYFYYNSLRYKPCSTDILLHLQRATTFSKPERFLPLYYFNSHTVKDFIHQHQLFTTSLISTPKYIIYSAHKPKICGTKNMAFFSAKETLLVGDSTKKRRNAKNSPMEAAKVNTEVFVIH